LGTFEFSKERLFNKFMKKIFIKHFFSFLLIIGFLAFLNLPMIVFASGAVSNLSDVAGKTALKEAGNPWVLVGNIIKAVLNVLGVLLLLVLIYAGALWGFISRGDSAQIKKAKEMIINAIIGLLIIFASYALTNFILTSIADPANQPPAASQ
jgi:hypothetical protein